MKILHLCDSLNPAGLGGYESIIHYLSKAMAAVGHESFVVTQSPYRNSPESVEKENYTIFHLPGNLLEARKWEFFSLPEDEREEAAGKMFKPTDINENVSLLTNQLDMLVKKLQPDIIHAHSIYIVFNKVITQMRLLNKLEIPVVMTLHGRPKSITLPDGRETTDYDELVADFDFDLVIAVSENVSKALKEHLDVNLHGKVRILYSGIDLTVFKPMPDLNKEWDVGFMGRLETMKSVDLFPDLLVILKTKFPELKMMMTGEGSLQDWLFNEFDVKDVTSMVDYLGVVETERVPALINKSRVFLYPSREEPFGLSIVEAMACGVPVVTTNVFGPKEIIRNNHNGIAVPPNDVESLAKAVARLLNDDELRKRISENGLKSVKDEYDIKKHARQLIDLYEEIISTNK